MNGLIYIHGKGGEAKEAVHYKELFPELDVVGMEYAAENPWDAKPEFASFFDAFAAAHEEVFLVADSIGAYFALHALSDKKIKKAYFISPVVDMEKLIMDMLDWSGNLEEDLEEQGEIATGFGETLSWEYLTWVREHKISWEVPTEILYGEKDHLQTYETVKAFADAVKANVTVMKGGEHWFHTPEQMAFLDQWMKSRG